MKIGIIAAMPEELVYLIQYLENAQEETVLGNQYHTGKNWFSRYCLGREWNR